MAQAPIKHTAGTGDGGIVSSFHPVVAEWFRRRFQAPTDAQAAGWPHIQSGRDVLIAAPTGSGKTKFLEHPPWELLVVMPSTDVCLKKGRM